MASYLYNCKNCGEIVVNLPMGTAEPLIACPECSEEAQRLFSSPHIGISSSDSKMNLIENTKRSADEPEVVDALPDSGRVKKQAVTRDPRHQKLPRP